MGLSEGPAHENDHLVTVWVEGELSVYQSDIEDVGTDQAVQNELGPSGFVVHVAEAM